MHGEQTRHQALQTGLQSLKWSECFWGLGFHMFRVSILLIQRYVAVQAASPLESFEVLPQSPSLYKRMKYKNTSILKRVEEKFWEKNKNISPFLDSVSYLESSLCDILCLTLVQIPSHGPCSICPCLHIVYCIFLGPKVGLENIIKEKVNWGFAQLGVSKDIPEIYYPSLG